MKKQQGLELKENKGGKFILIGASLLAVILAAAGIRQWYQPINEGLALPTLMVEGNTPAAGSSPGSPPGSGGVTQAPSLEERTPTPSPIPVPTLKPLCGGPAIMYILLIGSDGAGYLYGLSDVIRVVRVDFVTPRVEFLEFPRDIWVEIPDISSHYGITHGKLNQAYLYGNPGMGYYDGPAGGPGLLARTLSLNFGLRVDHYVAMDMYTFVRVVDAVGGVDITFPTYLDANPLGEPKNNNLIFTAGTHHLDGEQALGLARNRTPTTFQRARYQDMVLKSLRNKVLTPSVLPQIPQLVKAFRNSVLTDLSPADINHFICLAPKIPENNIASVSFPEEWFKPSDMYDPFRKVRTFIYDVDFELLRQKVMDFTAGTWPAP